jgi:predicted flap endonuclease-1-like 5' DNA nuclease
MRIEEVEGIGEGIGGTLRAAGIATTEDLLAAAGSASGREKLAADTGISEGQLLKWVNRVDLMRIPGVGSEFSDLLEAAGVDSPRELARRNAANLAQTFQEIDAARPNWIRRIPSQETVEQWIAAANDLEGAVSH